MSTYPLTEYIVHTSILTTITSFDVSYNNNTNKTFFINTRVEFYNAYYAGALTMNGGKAGVQYNTNNINGYPYLAGFVFFQTTIEPNDSKYSNFVAFLNSDIKICYNSAACGMLTFNNWDYYLSWTEENKDSAAYIGNIVYGTTGRNYYTSKYVKITKTPIVFTISSHIDDSIYTNSYFRTQNIWNTYTIQPTVSTASISTIFSSDDGNKNFELFLAKNKVNTYYNGKYLQATDFAYMRFNFTFSDNFSFSITCHKSTGPLYYVTATKTVTDTYSVENG